MVQLEEITTPTEFTNETVHRIMKNAATELACNYLQTAQLGYENGDYARGFFEYAKQQSANEPFAALHAALKTNPEMLVSKLDRLLADLVASRDQVKGKVTKDIEAIVENSVETLLMISDQYRIYI
jgi:hypothetical protein